MWNYVLHKLKDPLTNYPLELVESFCPQHDWKLMCNEIPYLLLIVKSMNVISKEEDPESYCILTNGVS